MSKLQHVYTQKRVNLLGINHETNSRIGHIPSKVYSPIEKNRNISAITHYLDGSNYDLDLSEKRRIELKNLLSINEKKMKTLFSQRIKNFDQLSVGFISLITVNLLKD